MRQNCNSSKNCSSTNSAHSSSSKYSNCARKSFFAFNLRNSTSKPSTVECISICFNLMSKPSTTGLSPTCKTHGLTCAKKSVMAVFRHALIRSKRLSRKLKRPLRKFPWKLTGWMKSVRRWRRRLLRNIWKRPKAWKGKEGSCLLSWNRGWREWLGR